MTRTTKFVTAVFVAIAVFVMPAASMPLHCMLMAPSGETANPCQMMGMSPSAGAAQFNSAPFNHPCCQASAVKPETMTVPQSPSGKGLLALPPTGKLLADLPAVTVVHNLLDSTVPSPGGPPQAVLCTFLI